MTSGTLAILGSGEIAPSMVKVHRQLLSTLRSRRGVMLDSPFGFQENVPQLSAKIIEYFATSLQVEMSTASLRDAASASALERASFIDAVTTSEFVFAGPGSPSYAMRQWSSVALTEALRSVIASGGVVTFSSAAALTLGKFTVPVYEIYKVGDEPHWIEGLDLLTHFGLECVVIPHFDNAEGQNHDTSRCYIGERRLELLERVLDDSVGTLGVDEHTAFIIDVANDTARVEGRGSAHWRQGSHWRHFPAGSTLSLSELRGGASVSQIIDGQRTPPQVEGATDEVARLGDVALSGSPDSSAAVAALVRLARSGGGGRIDPTELVEGVLAARVFARKEGQYALADALRDAVLAAGIEVHDGPSGTTWSLKDQ